MDFASWFEAYVDGQGYTFDARNNVPRIGRVLIARGRNAADVTISTTFGTNTLKSFKVWTDEVSITRKLVTLVFAHCVDASVRGAPTLLRACLAALASAWRA
jgi:transglutaminase-like putative cysteine protease